MRKLPARTQEVLLAAALLADPRLATIEDALGRPPDDDLGPAERATIARCDDKAVVFAHPLYASAVVAAAKDAERYQMHNRLAAATPAREQRARHLALGTAGADESLLESVAPGLVWLATLFSLLVLVQRTFAVETDADRAVLRLASRDSLLRRLDPVHH